MAQPSVLQSLGGPLGGQKFEFRGGNATLGSAPDCEVRLEAPGVEGYHAKIVIDITGATILRVDGVVGVNDDVVLGDSLLRSGDFVWIGEPGGATSLMFQFTLGDVDESADAPVAASSEEVVAEDLQAPAAAEESLVEEVASPEAPAAEAALMESPADEVAPMEPAPVEPAADEAAPAEAAPAEPPVAEAAPAEGPVETETMEVAEEPPMSEPAPSLSELAEASPAELPEAAAVVEPPMEEAMLEESDSPLEAEPPPPPPAPPAEEPEPELAEAPTLVVGAPEGPESAPVFEAAHDIEAAFEAPAAAFSPAAAPVVVPPAPWLTPSAPAVEAAPAKEYASAWETSPPPEAPPDAAADATMTAQAPAAAPVPAAPATPAARPAQPPSAARAGAPTPAPGTKRPTPPAAPKMRIRTTEQDAALRTPPPPPPSRTTSSTPMVLGGLAAFLVLAVGAFVFLRPAPAPAPPPPTPRPTPVATPEPTPEATQVAAAEPTVEATPEPTPAPTAAPVAPVATPAPRATPSPRTTPTPRATPTPAPARPAPTAPVVAAPVAAAPVSPAPRLIEEAKTAAAARDLPRASQLYGEALRAEPGNSEASARKAEVDGRIALLGRKFSIGATTILGGKTAGKGPTGFDLGGGGVVKTDFSAQIRCTTTPTAVEPGASYSVRCSILNIGSKAFKLESIAANETLDGAKTTGAGVAPRQDIAPQSDAVILERAGTWNARTGWSLEIVAKTTKDESFRAVYNWR